MTIFFHELRQGRKQLVTWAGAIGFLMLVCVMLFPEMKGEMADVSTMFASMGSFTAAFGMDRLNFGEFIGFYGIECGNIVGLGGAFFAALVGISALAKEEKEHTAEFLLTHPVSRTRVTAEKLAAVAAQLLLLNLLIVVLAVLSALVIGETVPWKSFFLLHLAYFFMQLEIAGICFGLSAFLHHGTLGIGLGLAVMFYFLNLIANLTEKANFLKYITPFGYSESADILTAGRLDTVLLMLGAVYTAAALAAAFVHYRTKDIA
ncbi:MAG: ABC transporter permease subunit [Eubacteriales bacterium]